MICHRIAFDLPTGCPSTRIDFPSINFCTEPEFTQLTVPGRISACRVINAAIDIPIVFTAKHNKRWGCTVRCVNGKNEVSCYAQYGFSANYARRVCLDQDLSPGHPSLLIEIPHGSFGYPKDLKGRYRYPLYGIRLQVSHTPDMSAVFANGAWRLRACRPHTGTRGPTGPTGPTGPMDVSKYYVFGPGWIDPGSPGGCCSCKKIVTPKCRVGNFNGQMYIPRQMAAVEGVPVVVVELNHIVFNGPWAAAGIPTRKVFELDTTRPGILFP